MAFVKEDKFLLLTSRGRTGCSWFMCVLVCVNGACVKIKYSILFLFSNSEVMVNSWAEEF